MTGDSADSGDGAQQDPHIRYCPVCGSEAEPLFEFTNDGSAEATVECPTHGEVTVEYYERD